ncbi:uncharacterized protein LOC111694634 [Trichogramma pretiosum]|uniref:uncharacterized protein LOC111694634 n=1 Tax=Trichogramma pretiosum TaxID=7493 RepID=UPI000C71AFD2|nr:uncharacterized protein LOC111694634 [Trichogramma pretiosum]
MDKKTEVKKIKSKRCCVHNCQNKTGITQVPFYHFPTDNKLFPHKVARRNAWIKAVRLNRSDGSEWQPSKHDLICGQHFVGNIKSEHPNSPSFNPTIFPAAYKNTISNPEEARQRFERWINRNSSSKPSVDLKVEDLSINTTCDSDLYSIDTVAEEKVVISTKSVGIQVYFTEETDTREIFISNLMQSSSCG